MECSRLTAGRLPALPGAREQAQLVERVRRGESSAEDLLVALSPKLVSVDFRADASHDRRMVELLIVISRALALALRGHREVILENLALRQQLAAA
jgi:hypothetical protein